MPSKSLQFAAKEVRMNRQIQSSIFNFIIFSSVKTHTQKNNKKHQQTTTTTKNNNNKKKKKKKKKKKTTKKKTKTKKTNKQISIYAFFNLFSIQTVDKIMSFQNQCLYFYKYRTRILTLHHFPWINQQPFACSIEHIPVLWKNRWIMIYSNLL